MGAGLPDQSEGKSGQDLWPVLKNGERSMRFENAELYNVHELLEGDGLRVVPEQTRERLKELGGDPDAVWGAEDGEGWWFCRIPDPLRLQLNPQAQLNALQATGAEVRFNLKGEKARIALKCTQAPVVAEVHQGSFFIGWHVVGREPTEIEVALPANVDELERLSRAHGLPFDARLTRVLLPWRPPTRLLGFEGDCEPPRPEQTPAEKCLAYGSSITHGNASVRPSGMYAHRAAQLLGVDLINLGFGGGAHLEREMADYIAARSDWDFASLEMGINLLWRVEVDEFARRVDYFVETIARAHPDQWIFCIDVFTCRDDLEGGEKARAFRKIVREKVESLDMPGLVHVPGDEILTSVRGLTADLVHPSPYGMEEMARNLSERIREKTGESDVRD